MSPLPIPLDLHQTTVTAFTLLQVSTPRRWDSAVLEDKGGAVDQWLRSQEGAVNQWLTSFQQTVLRFSDVIHKPSLNTMMHCILKCMSLSVPQFKRAGLWRQRHERIAGTDRGQKRSFPPLSWRWFRRIWMWLFMHFGRYFICAIFCFSKQYEVTPTTNTLCKLKYYPGCDIT